MPSTKAEDYKIIAKNLKEIDKILGAEYTPKKVTRSRQKGIHVRFFLTRGDRYWLFPCGKRIYHN